jgi:hypothetical protein
MSRNIIDDDDNNNNNNNISTGAGKIGQTVGTVPSGHTFGSAMEELCGRQQTCRKNGSM